MKFVGIGACVAVVAFCASSAWAGDYYVSGTLSAVFRPSLTVATETPAFPPTYYIPPGTNAPVLLPGHPAALFVTHTDYSPGFEIDAAIGRRFALGRYGALRVEAEFGFRQYQPKTMVTGDQGGPYAIFKVHGLFQQQYTETANLFYDLPAFHGFTPYLGGGVGYQQSVQTSGYFLDNGQDDTAHYSNSSINAGTWFAEAGVAMRLTKRLSIAPAYRFSQPFGGQRPINLSLNGQKPTDLMRVALRYSF